MTFETKTEFREGGFRNSVYPSEEGRDGRSPAQLRDAAICPPTASWGCPPALSLAALIAPCKDMEGLFLPARDY